MIRFSSQIHRRCLFDDAFGVDEPLNETAHGEGLVATGSHYALLSQLSEGMGMIKEEEKRVFYEPFSIFSPTTMTLQEFTSAPVNQVRVVSPSPLSRVGSAADSSSSLFLFEQRSLLKTALPEGINLLTLEKWRGDSLLLRLEHFIERNENGQPVTLDIKVMTFPELVNRKNLSDFVTKPLLFFLFRICSWILMWCQWRK